ncbi:hypothetical protein ED312_06750 [Sinomicrobium pectinilyticum]|uniref:Uncharacterized protein n=1 Tax=Sinomicrobium pectinilyticum TaxID=1084421 RepID=A0A3N0EQC4_SINP1|nr:hypothetical protein [Sinomicrobium pectinilyticum]RNL90118.1 hypothetical protein ED312_06750 [Sinomicrobium pectinilyticum]
MKQFEPYKNIRKRAMVLGLPLPFFALQMISVIGSLLVIIFSFSLGVIVSVLLWNMMLYTALGRIISHPELLHLKKVFPQTISNKKLSHLSYEED